MSILVMYKTNVRENKGSLHEYVADLLWCDLINRHVIIRILHAHARTPNASRVIEGVRTLHHVLRMSCEVALRQPQRIAERAFGRNRNPPKFCARAS